MSGDTIQHVPAWKRLGLKLKYAKDDVPSQSHGNGVKSHDATPSQIEGSQSKEPPRKKQRINGSSDAAIPTTPHKNGSSNPSTETQKLKKQVSFSADTKATDGDTARPATSTSVLPLISGNTTKDEKPASKPPKKPKTRSKASKQPQTSSPKPHAGLTYLIQFYNDHSAWKFNKSREVWILKHAFSESSIPNIHNFLLAVYLHNLKSTAARQRLKDECQKTRSAEKSGGESTVDETKRQVFLSQIKLFVVDPSDFTEGPEVKWAEEQNRADVIWWTLNPGSTSIPAISENTVNASLASGAALTQTTEKRRDRKSKRRVMDTDMSSSSSSSSESESSVLTESSSEDEDDTSDNGLNSTSSDSDSY